MGEQGVRCLEPAGEWPGGEAWSGSRGRGSEGGMKWWAWWGHGFPACTVGPGGRYL